MPRHSEKLTFQNPDGHALDARLELPAGTPTAFALFAHCFTCGKDVHAASRVARALAERGLAVLRFDFTGLGGSDGEFANTTFSSNVVDLVAAAEHLREHYRAPALLVGHSLGGAAVLAAAPRIPEVRAVATIAAPSTVDHVRRLLADDVGRIEREGAADVEIAGRRFRIGQPFLADLERQDLPGELAAARHALLVMHSPADAVVGIDHARRIYEAARHPKSFVALDGADHLLSRRADARFVGDVLAAWAARYVAAADVAAPGADAHETVPDELPHGVVEVTSTEGRYRQRVRAGDHLLVADEPESVGGEDAGPSPYGYLLAALGTCTAMTLEMYAERKGWALERVRVRLRHERIHAKDCTDCETREGQLDRIERELHVEGRLDAAQRARLAEIADRCPVHRTLTSETRIETRLAPAGETDTRDPDARAAERGSGAASAKGRADAGRSPAGGQRATARRSADGARGLAGAGEHGRTDDDEPSGTV